MFVCDGRVDVVILFFSRIGVIDDNMSKIQMLLLEFKLEDQEFVDVGMLVFKYDVWEFIFNNVMDNY